MCKQLWRNRNINGLVQLDGSSDYYNACNKKRKFLGVPNNYAGFQKARSGKGYAGFYLFNLNTMDEKRGFYDREYLHTTLVNPLEKSVNYLVTFYYSLADESQFYSSKFGICLSENKDIKKSRSLSRCLACDRSITQAIPQTSAADTVNWHKVEFEFMAQGGEKYLIIGLFGNDLSSSEFNKLVKKKRKTYNEFESSCYYYIDDVSIIRMKKKKNSPIGKINIVSDIRGNTQSGIVSRIRITFNFVYTNRDLEDGYLRIQKDNMQVLTQGWEIILLGELILMVDGILMDGF